MPGRTILAVVVASLQMIDSALASATADFAHCKDDPYSPRQAHCKCHHDGHLLDFYDCNPTLPSCRPHADYTCITLPCYDDLGSMIRCQEFCRTPGVLEIGRSHRCLPPPPPPPFNYPAYCKCSCDGRLMDFTWHEKNGFAYLELGPGEKAASACENFCLTTVGTEAGCSPLPPRLPPRHTQ